MPSKNSTTKSMKEKPSASKEFGHYLRSLRSAVGLSQDQVVEKANEDALRQKSLEKPLTKSTLSLYERGGIQSLRPEFAELLAKLYQVPYDELVTKWVRCTFHATSTIHSESFVQSASADVCELQSPLSGNILKIISVEELRRLQAALPDKSQVGVAALNFLDNDIFFEMVSTNIIRGVKYFYLLPEEERITYKVFLSRIASVSPNMKDRLDGEQTFFISRHPTDFPINYVLYLLPDGQIQGYIGLLHDRRVQLLQVTDPALSLRLYRSFSVAISLAQEASLQAQLHTLFQRAAERAMKKKKLSLLAE